MNSGRFDHIPSCSRRNRSRLPQRHSGRLAQLEERLVYTQKAGGSIPSPPTIGSGVPPHTSGGLPTRVRATNFSGSGEPAIADLLTFQDRVIRGRSPV